MKVIGGDWFLVSRKDGNSDVLESVLDNIYSISGNVNPNAIPIFSIILRRAALRRYHEEDLRA
jgi:hypothetical protein